MNNTLEYIDFILLAALIFDLFLKYRSYKKVKKQMGKWTRYQYNTTKLKYVLYAIILALSVGFYAFRLYGIVTSNPWDFPKIMILIPLIDYYVIWDLLFNGIYYNRHGIYYKSEYYEFRRAVHIYRDLVKDKYYEYEMIYRHIEGGIQNVYIKIPNEMEAFPLLATIPFEEV